MSLCSRSLAKRDFCLMMRHGAQMTKPPPSRPAVRPFGQPPRLKWDSPRARKPAKPNPDSKGALEKAEGEERIAKLLARAGVASRREVERMIADGG